jgi:hypothetical protein
MALVGEWRDDPWISLSIYIISPMVETLPGPTALQPSTVRHGIYSPVVSIMNMKE